MSGCNGVIVHPCNENQIPVYQLVNEESPSLALRKTAYRPQYLIDVESSHLPKKRKSLRYTTQGYCIEHFKEESECVENGAFRKESQQELKVTPEIHRLNEELIQFQSHARSLERELQETRREIKFLISRASGLSKLHVEGKCDCRNHFFSHRKPVQLNSTKCTGKNDSTNCVSDGSLQNRSTSMEMANKGKSFDLVSSKETSSSHWTVEEHKRFVQALSRFGKRDSKAISDFVGTRTITQFKKHMQRFLLPSVRESPYRNLRRVFRGNT